MALGQRLFIAEAHLTPRHITWRVATGGGWEAIGGQGWRKAGYGEWFRWEDPAEGRQAEALHALAHASAGIEDLYRQLNLARPLPLPDASE